VKSVIQIYKTGELKVLEAPPPQLRSGWVLVRNAHSLISAGTEKTKVDTARKNLLGKAMARPDLVKKLMAKARREGLWKAWRGASDRLEQPTALGYSCAGQVMDVCGDVDGLSRGDWVACGGSTANHAEIVCVPKNLVVPMPEGVKTEAAAFATIGAVALQGVRLAEMRLGEKVAVIGLGLVGLLTVQLLRASGCRVLGIDVDPVKLSLGKELGCDLTVHATDESLEEQLLLFTSGYGVDATIITAGTSSSKPVEQAGEMTREKGRVIVVGATGLEIPREPFYHKELEFRISRSYGPGRYDPQYEEDGHDYPYGYVRFTERRNMACFLELVQSGQMQLAKIITHRFPVDDAPQAYTLISGEKKEPYLGILLEYSRKEEQIPRRIEFTSSSHTAKPVPSPEAEPALRNAAAPFTTPLENAVHGGKDKVELSSRKTQNPAITSNNRNGKFVVGVIGAGNYAMGYLIPAIRDHPLLQLGTLCTGSGVSAAHAGQRFGFQSADADIDSVINQSDAILVATRHNDHSTHVIHALKKGKPVFVEKPLAITEEQLNEVIESLNAPLPSAAVGIKSGGKPSSSNGHGSDFPLSTSNHSLTVGFNRRFAPATELVRAHFASVKSPKQILIRINAGSLPADHWANNAQVGGGRLIGEGCHFVDLAVTLAGALVTGVQAMAIRRPDVQHALWEDFSLQLAMADGSVATLIYTAIGDSGLAKERIEISGGGRSAILDDFRTVELWHNGKRTRKSWSRQDKGQTAEIDCWAKGLEAGISPIPFTEIANVHRACLGAIRSLRENAPVSL
jgi:polar amino acid transport system substrate-binding protein